MIGQEIKDIVTFTNDMNAAGMPFGWTIFGVIFLVLLGVGLHKLAEL